LANKIKNARAQRAAVTADEKLVKWEKGNKKDRARRRGKKY